MVYESKSNRSPIIKITSAQSMEANHDTGPADGSTSNSDMPVMSCTTKLAQSTSSSSSSSGGAVVTQIRTTINNKLHQQQDASGVELQPTRGHNQPQAMSASTRTNEATHAYKMRWFVLAIFCTHSAINSFQWIQYSSITNIVSMYYGVSNIEVNLTSLVYMITYIPFIIHASLMLERVGLKNAICIGAAGTALGSLTKLYLGNAPTSTAFWGMMVGQTIVALSQLYIISIPPLLAAVWFPDHQVSTATGIGVFGNQLGIALGFIVPPLIISDAKATKEQIGIELNSLSIGVTVISIAIAIVACFCLKDKPPKPPGSASLHAAQSHQKEDGTISIETHASIKELCRDRDFQFLTLSYGINVGCFYAVSTVLNQMVAKKWPNPDDLAGTMGLLIVVSGMVGSVMCGQILDRTHAYKLIIVLIYLLSLVSMLLFTSVLKLLSGPWALYVASTTLGFFMTGYLPLGFEFAAEITYPHPANTPAGLLNLSAQVFGLGLTYASSLIVDEENGDLWANIFLTGCLTVGLALTAIMKADLKRQKAVAEEQMKI